MYNVHIKQCLITFYSKNVYVLTINSYYFDFEGKILWKRRGALYSHNI